MPRSSANATLTPTSSGGAAITSHSRFMGHGPLVPVIERRLHMFVADAAERLAAAAETRTG
jgi:hypothetical protein